jgi:hypothetical protein
MACRCGYVFPEMSRLLASCRPSPRYRRANPPPIRHGYQRRTLQQRMDTHPAAVIIKQIKSSHQWLHATHHERCSALYWVDDETNLPW